MGAVFHPFRNVSPNFNQTYLVTYESNRSAIMRVRVHEYLYFLCNLRCLWAFGPCCFGLCSYCVSKETRGEFHGSLRRASHIAAFEHDADECLANLTEICTLKLQNLRARV